jgi:hypothetical protein
MLGELNSQPATGDPPALGLSGCRALSSSGASFGTSCREAFTRCDTMGYGTLQGAPEGDISLGPVDGTILDSE